MKVGVRSGKLYIPFICAVEPPARTILVDGPVIYRGRQSLKPSSQGASVMLTSNIKTVRNDMKTLVKDAQELFREAGEVTGEKAEDLRAKGLILLDTAMEKAQEVQTIALEKGKAVAQDADEFVHQNPWKAVAISAGVGMLIGMLISRK
jgi:ElaB/YqjD/DUF883 family membrane-anchored ribosome-binding protein